MFLIGLAVIPLYLVTGYALFRLAMLAEGKLVLTKELAEDAAKDPKNRAEFRNTLILFWPLFLFTVLVSFTIALFKKSWRDDGNFDK